MRQRKAGRNNYQYNHRKQPYISKRVPVGIAKQQFDKHKVDQVDAEGAFVELLQWFGEVFPLSVLLCEKSKDACGLQSNQNRIVARENAERRRVFVQEPDCQPDSDRREDQTGPGGPSRDTDHAILHRIPQ